MKDKLITIITVVRNDKANIGKTMLAVLSQTYQHIEYIVVDGCSTDGTLNIIERDKDDRTIVISEPDKGVYDAMNKGIAHSHGDWVIFMNSGDVFHDANIISEVVNRAYNEKETLYYGNVKTHYWDGDVVEKPREFFKTNMKFKGIGICHQTMFFPGEILRRMRYDLQYKIASDYDLALRMYKQGVKFEYIDLTIADYEWGNGISSNPYGLIEVYRENAKVAKQEWNVLYWGKLMVEYIRLIMKKKRK